MVSLRVLKGIACVLAVAMGTAAFASDRTAPRSLAEVVPGGAVAFVEVNGLEAVIDRVRQSDLLQKVLESPAYKDARNQPQFAKADAGRRLLEVQLGMDAWTAGKRLFGRQAAAAFYPGEGQEQPDGLVVVRASDPAILELLRLRAEPWLLLAGENVDLTETVAGVPIVGVKGPARKLFIGIKEEWLVLASRRALLADVLERLVSPEDPRPSLAGDGEFQLMTRDMGAGQLARAFVNTGQIARSQGGRLGPEKLDNPLGSLLVGGMAELAAHSPYAGGTLDLGERGLVLTAGVAGHSGRLGEAHRSLVGPAEGPGATSIPRVPGLISGFTLDRDFAAWYRHREILLEERLLPEFDKFEAGLANLLPGRDFGEDVLPRLGRNVTFVAAPQSYEHLGGSPGVKLPGFALVFELAHPDEGADLLNLVFQTLTAVLNFQAGEQGRQPWVMTSETYQGVQINYGRYLAQSAGERLPVVFNFSPSSARVGRRYVLSTSVGLTRQLVDALQAPAAAPAEVRDFEWTVSFPALADLAAANRDVLRARGLQEGKSAERVDAELDGLLLLLRSLDELRLTTHPRAEAYQLRLEGSWK